MNIVKTVDQYNENFVFFCDPIKNNVISESNFIRIIYSTYNMSLNGIYFLLQFNDIICDKYYNKYKCTFNISNNLYIIDRIKNIEISILDKIYINNKEKQYKIYEQIKSGNFKIFCDILPKQSSKFILKISGIWESKYTYGLTYKFLSV